MAFTEQNLYDTLRMLRLPESYRDALDNAFDQVLTQDSTYTVSPTREATIKANVSEWVTLEDTTIPAITQSTQYGIYQVAITGQATVTYQQGQSAIAGYRQEQSRLVQDTLRLLSPYFRPPQQGRLFSSI